LVKKWWAVQDLNLRLPPCERAKGLTLLNKKVYYHTIRTKELGYSLILCNLVLHGLISHCGSRMVAET
jgi:hypothetical protein